ncbi:diphosphomevalonate decarboxylase [Lactobacillus selangorensis]|uniref:diphosphomevalonate decarboxylase n=1 Tax=Lactobacillus selangorensis TaxID=81857 RepID=A0A0R2FZP6_9LACO|nr:diphosphomevalonate decarboxylase [Lactobacillus selangorensis]KRN29499.1 diphosphomevalonate decarboxylase [Lactobacillus selangorensis]KRN33971.1 diphosphomevalonate decarboxylase [Lactobacillus selangorensis]
MQTVTARAHTNIALVKYWGKKNQELILPYTNSLSLTLDVFYTDTSVQFDPLLETDQFLLNGENVTGKSLIKVQRFMDLIRSEANIAMPARIESTNHVPTAAGLASSASAFAALAAAGSRAAGLDLSLRDLSRLARRGSGSATRSIYGGFVEWERGDSDATSYAVPIQEQVDWDIQMIAILLNRHEKKVSSRSEMANDVATSPYYPAWIENAQTEVDTIKQAIAARDLNQVGQIAEQSAMRMHALTMSAVPPFTYFEPSTLQAIAKVQELRAQGLSCYYTMDAGPNVKVICSARETPQILAGLSTIFPKEQLTVAKPGPGIQYLPPQQRSDL